MVIPRVILLLRMLSVFCVFAFPDEFKDCSFHIFEEFCWDFDGNSIVSIDFLWYDGHFYYIILPIHEHRRSLHSVIFYFFLERLEFIVTHVFHLFGKSYSQDILYYLWLLWRELISLPVYHLYKGRLLICLG